MGSCEADVFSGDEREDGYSFAGVWHGPGFRLYGIFPLAGADVRKIWEAYVLRFQTGMIK